ncbi:zinc finger and SCAN domain-containing protein 30-like [Elgaria multicarinata webbii]|uniref:zinc finger and SCAN domain-containing protein 30-like n=1 Tax=Elgaria multicarinata webbii TaxID=159646 RepID=UPI002FCCFE2E
MAEAQEMKPTGSPLKQDMEPEIKMEEQDSSDSEPGEIREGAVLPKIEKGSEETGQKVKQEPEEGPSGNWDAQLQEFLRTLQAPSLGGENPQLSEQGQWIDTKTAQGPSQEATPRGLWVSQLQPHLIGEDGQEHKIDLEATDGGNGKVGVFAGGAAKAEMQRQHFRTLRYQEADGPHEHCRQLQELCRQWLRPETRTKEQIVELVTLEQFQATLPLEMRNWLRESGPETCVRAVSLAKDFLVWQQEAKGWEQRITGASEEAFTNPPSANQALPDQVKTQLSAEAEQEGGGNASVLAGDQGLSENEEQKPFLESPEQVRVLLKADRGKAVLHRREADENRPSRSTHFATHESTTAKEMAYKCWHCGQRFSSSTDLLVHERTHVGEKMYKCSLCGERERMLIGQKPHKCSHCGNTLGWNPQGRIQPGQKPYSCSECGKEYLQISDFLNHQRIHKRKNPYKCSKCGENFGTYTVLKAHRRTHAGENQYKCSHCGMRFNWSSHLRSHERIHVAVCSFCGKSFSQKSELVEHERTHAPEESFACFACGKTFEVSSELAAHVRTYAETPLKCSVSGKSFRCSECGDSFNHSSALIVHRRIHTGKKS